MDKITNKKTMTTPTRDEVEDLSKRLKRYLHMPNGEGEEIQRVLDAYLAQAQELEKIEKRIIGDCEIMNTMSQKIHELGKEVKGLKADNKALQADRQSLAGKVSGLNKAVVFSEKTVADIMAHCRQLEADNQALRADIEQMQKSDEAFHDEIKRIVEMPWYEFAWEYRHHVWPWARKVEGEKGE